MKWDKSRKMVHNEIGLSFKLLKSFSNCSCYFKPNLILVETNYGLSSKKLFDTFTTINILNIHFSEILFSYHNTFISFSNQDMHIQNCIWYDTNNKATNLINVPNKMWLKFSLKCEWANLARKKYIRESMH